LSNCGVTNLIIIGAPRSGTNMLRDILTSFEGFATWPCDEINYIWRHGNMFYPSDEMPVKNATPQVKKYIQNSFDVIRKKYNADVLVEKTCANSLRVPFVDSIIPDAKYIFIYRDGIDVAGSAKERWTAKLDISYILTKVKFVPITDLPVYALRYFWARLFRFFSNENRLAFWGPELESMQSILQKHTLREVCALQWQQCVEKAEESFSKMSADKVERLKYEDFVRQPEKELKRILKFVGKDIDPSEITKAVRYVSPHSINKGRKYLVGREVKNLESLVGETLKRYDYL
jgi:hypothetical protein